MPRSRQFKVNHKFWLGYCFIFLSFTFLPPANAYTLKTCGNVGQIAVPVIALLATLSHRDAKGTLQLAEAYGTAMGTTFILKPTVNRKRPDGGNWSFPSGHSASAFASASFLDRRYGRAYGIPTYLAAIVVGYSRVAAKRHFATDVMAGAAIGIGANFIFTTPFKKLSLLPLVDREQTGIQAHVSW
jgi:membrane-associated phospholipid phosphatase